MPKSKNEILDELWRSQFIDDLIYNITSGHKLKDDLKGHLFLILCEMPEKRIVKAYEDHYLNYMCINILKKQYHSSSSPFHKLWRANKGEELFDVEIEDDTFDEDMIEKVFWFVDNKLELVDRELFKMYYKVGRYDRWLGDLRDENCQKPTYAFRKIQKKLEITTVEGRKISIGHDSVRVSLSRSVVRIKNYLKRNGYSDKFV